MAMLQYQTTATPSEKEQPAAKSDWTRWRPACSYLLFYWGIVVLGALVVFLGVLLAVPGNRYSLCFCCTFFLRV